MKLLTPLLATAFACLAFASLAEEADTLVKFYDDSGSLPPEYAWATEVTITTEGKLTLRYCVGYETEGSACKTRKAKVDEAHRAAILAAVAEGNLVAKPARDSDEVIVGGGSTGGKVFVDGVEVSLPANPIDADKGRVNTVIKAIREAIPQRFRDRYFDRN